ncbi:hypothetical protein U0070_018641 [Myodes glareolus]|uniref:Uncharacterized protein n=1 Tax=Myodes glareolus TaxID=447135 RepID=A0AAW0ITQ2_MYOGA
MQQENMKSQEQLTLETYERDHAVVVGVYRPPPKSYIFNKIFRNTKVLSEKVFQKRLDIMSSSTTAFPQFPTALLTPGSDTNTDDSWVAQL